MSKRFKDQNRCARAFLLIHFFAVLCKTATQNDLTYEAETKFDLIRNILNKRLSLEILQSEAAGIRRFQYNRNTHEAADLRAFSNDNDETSSSYPLENKVIHTVMKAGSTITNL